MKRKSAHLPALPHRGRALGSLARALVRAQRLGEAEAAVLSEAAHNTPGGWPAVLVAKGYFDAPALAAFLSEQFGYPLIALDALDPARLPDQGRLPGLPRAAWTVVLGREAGRLTVAVADPTDDALMESVRAAAGVPVQAVLTDVACLGAWLERIQAAD